MLSLTSLRAGLGFAKNVRQGQLESLEDFRMECIVHIVHCRCRNAAVGQSQDFYRLIFRTYEPALQDADAPVVFNLFPEPGTGVAWRQHFHDQVRRDLEYL